jgi:hypothetical protein
MHICPNCQAVTHRSHVRNRWERLRKRITRKRPYRCHNCEWRGWGEDPGPKFTDHAPEWSPALHNSKSPAAGRRAGFDLEQIDASDRRSPS